VLTATAAGIVRIVVFGDPALVLMPGLPVRRVARLPRVHPGLRRGGDGQETFLPALGAPQWPWTGRQVYVLTSRPLPPGVPDDVIVVRDGPAALAERRAGRRAAASGGDVALPMLHRQTGRAWMPDA
jgi:hypothetical protein